MVRQTFMSLEHLSVYFVKAIRQHLLGTTEYRLHSGRLVSRILVLNPCSCVQMHQDCNCHTYVQSAN